MGIGYFLTGGYALQSENNHGTGMKSPMPGNGGSFLAFVPSRIQVPENLFQASPASGEGRLPPAWEYILAPGHRERKLKTF